MNGFAKYICALVAFLIVAAVVIGPIALVINGFSTVCTHYVTGCMKIFVGLVFLWLVKPVSIITGKDFKIM